MQRLVGKREHAPDFLCVTYSKKSVTNLHFQENLVSENCNCKYCVCILIQVLESLGEGYTVISLNIVSLIYQFLLFCVFFFFQAYKWCIEAMKEITVGLPVKVVVDVLRQASKVNMMLKLLMNYRIQQALNLF